MKSPAVQPPVSSNKPIIAVDFDDTIVYNAQRVVDAYNRQHGGKVSLHDVYVAQKFGNPEHGWHHNRAEAREWIRQYLTSKEGWDHPPLPGVVEVLNRLSQYYDFVIVTGRRDSWDGATKPWLQKYMPDAFKKVYYCGDTPKAEVCKEAGASIMIDDSPYYLKSCTDAGIHCILFGDYPWSTHIVLDEVERAATWAEVGSILTP